MIEQLIAAELLLCPRLRQCQAERLRQVPQAAVQELVAVCKAARKSSPSGFAPFASVRTLPEPALVPRMISIAALRSISSMVLMTQCD
jgi:hypothetical protein